MSDLLYPFTSVVAAVLARTHSIAISCGLASGSAGAWLVAIVLLVVAVRGALVPVTIHGVRATHRRAGVAPQLRALQRRYAGSRDVDSLRQLRAEQRRVRAEHGVSTWSLAPALLQLPVVYALYRVVSDLTAGHAVGALDASLVASASAVSVLGLTLTSRIGGQLPVDLPAALVLIGMALVAAALTVATQRLFTLPMTDLAEQARAVTALQHAMPWLVGAGVLAAAWFVPAGLLAYWVVNNAWTFVQQGLIWRFAPTPGSPAARRRSVLGSTL